MSEYKLADIALLINAELIGDKNSLITNIAKIEEAKSGDLSFIANPKYLKFGKTTKATALIVSKTYTTNRNDIALLKVDDPYFAFLKIMESVLAPKSKNHLSGIHPSAIINDNVKIGKNVYIGPNTVIYGNCTIGDNVIIHALVYIGEDTIINDNSLIYPNVVIRNKITIGKNVIIHPGAIIGSDGFGFVPNKSTGKYDKLPQLGGVIIEDNVEIGANTTIDRATIGNTIIHSGTKLDNLIQIAHNVVIGENSAMAAQSGISGSTKLGKNCIVAGQVGLVGHIEVADKIAIGAQSGVSKSLKKEGATYFGTPAKELRETLKIEAIIRQLPELLLEIKELKQKIQDLEKQVFEKNNYASLPENN
jgi:UDP-3-O-[3-hydroxymyristoyl] glucosamine N-acyltransferase